MAETHVRGAQRPAPTLQLGDLLGGDGTQAEQVLDDRVLDSFLHLREQLVALALVLVLRIALAVAAEADPLLQVVEGEQMVLPGRVDDAKHVVALGGA